MKKIHILIITVLMLSACGGAKPLYEVSDIELISDLKNAELDLVVISDEDFSHMVVLSDEEGYATFKDAFLKLNAKKENIGLEGACLTVDIYGAGGFASAMLYDNGLELRDSDDNLTIYSSSNVKEVVNALMAIEENNHVTYDGESLFDYAGLSAYLQNSEIREDGNLVLEVGLSNQDETAYAVRLNAKIDGIPFHQYQSFIVYGNNDISYGIDTCSFVKKDLCGVEAGELEVSYDVYAYNEDTYEAGELLFTSEPFTYEVSSDKSFNVSNPVLSSDQIELYSVMRDDPAYSIASFYVKNKTNRDLELHFNGFTVNDSEEQDMSGTPELSLLKLSDEAIIFFPIYTFNYNEETGEVSYFTIDSVNLQLEIIDGDAISQHSVVVK